MMRFTGSQIIPLRRLESRLLADIAEA